MKEKYLNKDIKGASSKIKYGKKNDKVYIIGRQNEMILVSHNNGRNFFVKENDLSDELLPL